MIDKNGKTIKTGDWVLLTGEVNLAGTGEVWNYYRPWHRPNQMCVAQILINTGGRVYVKIDDNKALSARQNELELLPQDSQEREQILFLKKLEQ